MKVLYDRCPVGCKRNLGTDINKGQESKNVQISRAHLFLRKLPQTKNNNTPHGFVVLLCFLILLPLIRPRKLAKK